MQKVKRILAPNDFSELSKTGIHYTLEMARNTSAEVIVYHAIDIGEGWKEIQSEMTPYHDLMEENPASARQISERSFRRFYRFG